MHWLTHPENYVRIEGKCTVCGAKQNKPCRIGKPIICMFCRGLLQSHRMTQMEDSGPPECVQEEIAYSIAISGGDEYTY